MSAAWRNLWLIALMSAVAGAMLPTPALAGALESLLMPGPVIEGHAEYENECSRCHSVTGRRSQRSLCLDCHDTIAADIDASLGYHGRGESIRTGECESCHTEHQGRDADIVKLNTQAFDHELTDFALRGAHLTLACAACHEAGARHRDASRDCSSCHEAANPHGGRLGGHERYCGGCHRETRWTEIRFDHQDTDFALTGRHREVLCAACHPNDRIEDTPTACASCHRIDDVHRGKNGERCDDCHSTRSWDEVQFDHARDTEFPLRGAHADVACAACHEGRLDGERIWKSCASCHRFDDAHKGRYGLRCETCHNERGWSEPTFDHGDDTEFALLGRHAEAACSACHPARLYDTAVPTDCFGCHDVDDDHNGGQGEQCGRCHSPEGWRHRPRFDHDVTHFPLIGLHASVPCEECHQSSEFSRTPAECDRCHDHQDEHQGGLGSACGRCHTPNGWKLWRFDHDVDTRFPIDGAHEQVHCHECHYRPVETPDRQPRPCAACHRRDDAHRGQFGPVCGRCHDTESFTNLDLLVGGRRIEPADPEGTAP